MNRNGVIAGVVIALLVVGGVYAYQNFFVGPSAPREDYQCARAECGWNGGIKLTRTTGWPPKCPKCDNRTVLPLATCGKCGNRQLTPQSIANFIDKTDAVVENVCGKCKAPFALGD